MPLGIPTSDGAPRTPTAAIDAAPSGGANEPSGPERFVQLTSSRPICARSNKGRVYCWGASSGGLLGDDDASTSPASPVAIPALDGASDLAVGGDRQTFFPASGARICALRHGGEIWCSARPPIDGFHHVVTVESARSLVMVREHVCVLDAKGDVSCGMGGFADNEESTWPYPSLDAFVKGPHPDLANDNPFNVWNVWPVLDGIREVRVNRSVLCTLSKLDRVECKDMDSDNGRSVSIGGVDDFVVWASFYVCGRKKPGPWSCKAGTSTGKPDPAEADVETAISAVAGDHTAYADEGHICVVDPAGGVACRMTTDPRKDPWTRWGRTPLEVHDWPVASIVFGGDQACMLGTDGAVRCWGDPKGATPSDRLGPPVRLP